jgi:hypothetical protein
MTPPRVPLKELSAAVQNAVEQVLGKHGALGIDKIWVGFVAPDKIATVENAGKIAALMGKETGATLTPSVGQIAGKGAALVGQPPGHICGYIHSLK